MYVCSGYIRSYVGLQVGLSVPLSIFAQYLNRYGTLSIEILGLRKVRACVYVHVSVYICSTFVDVFVEYQVLIQHISLHAYHFPLFNWVNLSPLRLICAESR